MNPLRCVDSTELELSNDVYRDITTNILPGGESTKPVFVRTFRLRARWKAESPDSVWMVWVQYTDDDMPPRLLGITKNERSIDAILYRELAGHVYKAVYIIQQYAPE